MAPTPTATPIIGLNPSKFPALPVYGTAVGDDGKVVVVPFDEFVFPHSLILNETPP